MHYAWGPGVHTKTRQDKQTKTRNTNKDKTNTYQDNNTQWHVSIPPGQCHASTQGRCAVLAWHTMVCAYMPSQFLYPCVVVVVVVVVVSFPTRFSCAPNHPNAGSSCVNTTPTPQHPRGNGEARLAFVGLQTSTICGGYIPPRSHPHHGVSTL